MLFGYFVNFGNSIIFFLSRLGEDAPLKFPYGVSIINDFIYLLSPLLYLLRLVTVESSAVAQGRSP